ncbi:MAG TPA: SUF system Fe-S cluster assembly regulator [Gammaproteobacteria bacterium]|nr:SUF system Fe-S cluster assembly regulator [Gammaproteobacteria bacterium]
MLRLSKLTDYGTVVLAHMAAQPKVMHTASDLAARTHLALPTVSKLLKLFARGGLVHSYRGAQGGYKLARKPEEITAVQIIDAVEGPVAITECSVRDGLCNLEPVCAIGHNWQRISLSIREALKTVTLAELAGPMPTRSPQIKFAAVPRRATTQ